MPQKCTDILLDILLDNMLKLTTDLVYFIFSHVENIRYQTFRKSVPADAAPGLVPSLSCKLQEIFFFGGKS